MDRVEKRLDAEAVARCKQGAMVLVPQDESKLTA